MALGKDQPEKNNSTSSKRLDKVLASQEKPALRLVNKEGKSVSDLKIADLSESIEPRKPIGTVDLKTQTFHLDTDHDGKKTAEEARDYTGKTVVRNTPVALGSELGFEVLSAPELYPENSEDRFFVEYENKALAGKKTIEVDFKTQNPNNPRSLYQDAAKITLYEVPGKPGFFKTKELILVSNRVFDQHEVDNQPDNSLKDQTFLAELGGRVSVSYKDETSGQTVTTLAQVPPQKLLEVQPIIYKDKNGKPVATEQDVERQLKSMQEEYAQAGILVVKKETLVLDLPEGLGIDITQGLTRRQMEMLAFDTSGYYRPQEGIRMILVGGEHAYIEKDPEVFGVVGYALGVGFSGGIGSYQDMDNSLFIGIGNNYTNIAGHEGAHILIGKQKVPGHDEGGHFNTSKMSYQDISRLSLSENYDFIATADKLNLMYVVPFFPATTLDGQHHLTKEQKQAMLKNPILKDPPNVKVQPQPSVAP